MYTLYVPPRLNIPIFIATTLIIRDACTRSLSALSLFPPDEASTLINVDPTLVSYTSTTLGYLHDLAATPFLWCPSLVLPDPTLGLPLAVGLVSLLNVEYSAKTRRVNAVAAVTDNNARAQDEVKNRVKVPSNVVTGGGRAMTTAEKRRAMGVKVNKVDEVVDVPPESPFNRNLTNAMRGGSVAFIWLASMAPVVSLVLHIFGPTLTTRLGRLWLLADVESVYTRDERRSRKSGPTTRRSRPSSSSPRKGTLEGSMHDVLTMRGRSSKYRNMIFSNSRLLGIVIVQRLGIFCSEQDLFRCVVHCVTDGDCGDDLDECRSEACAILLAEDGGGRELTHPCRILSIPLLGSTSTLRP
jgi:hypothetical protein